MKYPLISFYFLIAELPYICVTSFNCHLCHFGENSRIHFHQMSFSSCCHQWTTDTCAVLRLQH